MTEIEDKLDEDFLFYLGFTKAWLDKLCGEQCHSVQTKRYRNIYLSNLLLCMQEGRLTEPFQVLPALADMSDALDVFGYSAKPEIDTDFLKELATSTDEQVVPRDGRTYLATRTLPNGEGAFAYIAITLADNEPKWLGGGEGVIQRISETMGSSLHSTTTRSKSASPEVEQILKNRVDPAERERVLTFYKTVLANINNELENEIKPEDNVAINNMIEQLVTNLKEKNQYHEFERYPAKRLRTELLVALHERIYARINKIMERESLLDDLEHETLPPSLFDISVQLQDKIELPAAMWEQAINKVPNKKNMDLLFEHYPNVLIEKFLNLLSNEKEEIAVRLQKRHENMVSEMKKDMRKQAEKEKHKAEGTEHECIKILQVLDAIKSAYQKQQDVLKAINEKKRAGRTEQEQLYSQLKAALYDTQISVEEEAERGRLLKDEINSVNTQTEVLHQVHDDSIKKVEAANIKLMQNIKKLRNAVVLNENRVAQLKSMSSGRGKGGSGSSQLFIF